MTADSNKTEERRQKLSSFIFKLTTCIVLFLIIQVILTISRHLYQAEFRIEESKVRITLYVLVSIVGVCGVLFYFLQGYSKRDSTSEVFTQRNEYFLFVIPVAIIFNSLWVSPSPWWSGELMSDLSDISFFFSFILLFVFVINLIRRHKHEITRKKETENKIDKEKKRNYYEDRELGEYENDSLKRYDFARDITKAIVEQGAQNFTIGILGEWGSGKSSVYTLIKKELKEINESKEYVTMDFKPWYFGSDNHEIIRTYLFQLIDIIKEDNGFDPLLDKKLRQYASYMSAFNLRAGGMIFSFKDFLDKYNPSKDSLKISDVKKKIDTLLKKSTKKIIVFIDDIDRLDRDEIKMVFKLIRLVADFPKITYILALDEKVVSASLAESNDEKSIEIGKRYLDKFIQLPIYLPKAEQLNINNMAWERLPEDLKQDNLQQDELFQHMSTLEVTPRDTVRFVNLVSFFVPILKGEVNLKDLVYLLLIQVKSPELYRFIGENGSNLVEGDTMGTVRKSLGLPTGLNDGLKEYFRKSVSEVEKYQDILTDLFPRAEYFYSGEKNKKRINQLILDKDKRICSSQYFAQYFRYGLPSREVPQKVLEKVLDKLKDQKLSLEEKYKLYDEELNLFDANDVYKKLRFHVEQADEKLRSTMIHLAMRRYEQMDSQEAKFVIEIFLRVTVPMLKETAALKNILEQDWSLSLTILIYKLSSKKGESDTVLNEELGAKIRSLYNKQASMDFFEKLPSEEAETLLREWFKFEDESIVKHRVSKWFENDNGTLESFLSIVFSHKHNLGVEETLINQFLKSTNYMDDDFLKTVFKKKNIKTIEALAEAKKNKSSSYLEEFFYAKSKIYDYVYERLAEIVEVNMHTSNGVIYLKSDLNNAMELVLKFGDINEVKNINNLLNKIHEHNRGHEEWEESVQEMFNEQRRIEDQDR